MSLTGRNKTVAVHASAHDGQPAGHVLPENGRVRTRWAASAVAAFLAMVTPVNAYWGFGGTWGLAWVLGCDCAVPLVLVWVQQVALLAGIIIVLGRAGIWRPPLPGWVLRAGTWSMATVLGAVALQNLLGDNTLQAQLLFVPVAAIMSTLCVIVARDR